MQGANLDTVLFFLPLSSFTLKGERKARNRERKERKTGRERRREVMMYVN